MIKFNDATKENIKEHNPNWPQIPDHPYIILITGGWRSGKTNSLFNLINYQLDIAKIYLYAKDPHEAKYQFLINKQEITGLKLLLNTRTIWMMFIKKIEEYNPKKPPKNP